jgi:hypothetical protein
MSPEVRETLTHVRRMLSVPAGSAVCKQITGTTTNSFLGWSCRLLSIYPFRWSACRFATDNYEEIVIFKSRLLINRWPHLPSTATGPVTMGQIQYFSKEGPLNWNLWSAQIDFCQTRKGKKRWRNWCTFMSVFGVSSKNSQSLQNLIWWRGDLFRKKHLKLNIEILATSWISECSLMLAIDYKQCEVTHTHSLGAGGCTWRWTG